MQEVEARLYQTSPKEARKLKRLERSYNRILQKWDDRALPEDPKEILHLIERNLHLDSQMRRVEAKIRKKILKIEARRMRKIQNVVRVIYTNHKSFCVYGMTRDGLKLLAESDQPLSGLAQWYKETVDIQNAARAGLC